MNYTVEIFEYILYVYLEINKTLKFCCYTVFRVLNIHQTTLYICVRDLFQSMKTFLESHFFNNGYLKLRH